MPSLLTALILGVLIDQSSAGMSSVRFRQREAATAALRNCGEMARPTLERLAIGMDVEASRRASVLLAHLDRSPRKVVDRIMSGKAPWICIEHYGHPAVNVWLERARASKYDSNLEGEPDWTIYRIATILWVRKKLQCWSNWAEVADMLQFMVQTEHEWHQTPN